MKNRSTIQLPKELREKLAKLKKNKRDTYEMVLERMIKKMDKVVK